MHTTPLVTFISYQYYGKNKIKNKGNEIIRRLTDREVLLTQTENSRETRRVM